MTVGGVPFFFYGTLMDVDVLNAVTDRRFPPSALGPAEIIGWRRVFRAGASYPILVPQTGARVDGVVVMGLRGTDVARLTRFEGSDYEIADVQAYPRYGSVLMAKTFMAHASVPATTKEWSFQVWRRRHKGRYQQRLRTGLSAD